MTGLLGNYLHYCAYFFLLLTSSFSSLLLLAVHMHALCMVNIVSTQGLEELQEQTLLGLASKRVPFSNDLQMPLAGLLIVE